ncbi:DNA replication ATP-dependent helicase/nuclease DNA2 isoform X2 [Melanaphis sacchari]|uniref:DNA replication ATP-dependent helicase/nuclease n=1 Tax=Melanaphis sacchari TaxID=742174 RepID=A0A2H8TS85_9HEMI|nr:DNA replication ATP-dependent helicase/nuclease DNA2 isoform X2 [Melanaphis sacchari]
MKRTHSKVQKTQSGSKQMKITSLFSRIPSESSKTITEYNDKNESCTTPNSKSFTSPLSSPDVIPPSPVLKKNKVTKSKKCLNRVLINDIKLKEKEAISNTDTVSSFPKENLSSTAKSTEKRDFDNHDVDSQPYSFDTVSLSIESSSTEFSTDFFLDCDINFIEPQRCIVKKIEKDFGKICLTLTSCKSYEEDVCYLSGIWLHSLFEKGDIVTVMAKKLNGNWSVNNDHGFVTRHSDFLVSGTTIVGSLFCSRRSILADIYKGLDCSSAVMVIGTLLHELLQTVLRRKQFNHKDIKAIVDEMINSPGFVHTLYESDMSFETTKKELMDFIPKIQAFIKTYLVGYKIGKEKKTWQGEIVSIEDIEDNLWVPAFGVKGKVDITVRANYDGLSKIMPIELKTGRASGSEEHRGQVLLYTMMMNELGMDVDSGLLLYLRENVLTQVKVSHREKRDLIMLRNRLVHYLNANKMVSNPIDDYFPTLPEPINHHNACSKCPYLTACSAVLSKEGFEKLDHHNLLKKLGPQAISHLKSEHINYVMEWTAFLILENSIENTKDNLCAKSSDLWTLSFFEREKRGNCISLLKIKNVVKEPRNRYYLNTMEKSDKSVQIKFTNFSVDNYVIVSTRHRNAVATGFISSISEKSIDVLLDRDLSKLGPNEFHIDKYESQSIIAFNFSSLALLLEPSENSAQLRRFIIDKELPSFLSSDNHLNSFIESSGLTLNLNSSQKSAIIKTLAANNYALIKGMPGTGKTSTVATLIQLLVLMGRSVLVTSHTHSAVDNLLLLLHKNKIDFLRLGSKNRIHPDLWEKCDEVVSQRCDTPEKLSKLYNQANIVGVTCLGCGHALLRKRTFDVCIVDEATQVVQSSVIAALYSSKMFVLVGDPQQLPPLIKNKKAKELGMDVSMFERLDRPSVTAILPVQYRMNGPIAELANKYTYNGSLQCANNTVKYATLKLNKTKVDDDWCKDIVSSDLNKSVLLLDTGTVNSSSSDTNLIEINFIRKIVLLLIQGGLLAKSIGVIAPYRAQVALLKNEMASIHSEIEVNTVDQYQGRDKEVIIYSCTKNTVAKDVGILNDKRRITVAITRAKHKLIMIGDVTTMKNYETFNSLFSHITNIIKLPQI